MRLLVLGGTVFLSRAVAEAALSRGHEVTTVSRGVTGSPPDGARHVRADRDATLPAELGGVAYDAVVDVASRPSRVRSALAQLRAPHWVYVSSISVYADEATVGGAPGMLPQHEPLDEDSDDMADYGRLKAGCERLVGEQAPSRAIVRPGLIAGPGDRSGRFTYWVDRMRRARDGEVVLAPGDPSDRVQLIDVRDLGSWVALLAERRTTGVFDAIGEPAPIRDVLADVAAGCGVRPRWRWASDAQLEGVGVNPWMGPRSLPLWLPRPEYDGMTTHLAAPAFQAGLRTRPMADTARDTLAWLETAPDAALTGLTADEEREVLAALG
ncbi:NAD-dependent epimerase/dehydratase family protein [Microbacterium sp.]|uniref:NAD-dependent epimerase/dehydratase family protein n=1 Tax=Microbacterium sp. TaxID=51671 RepID=UPI002811C3BF|nr:NAD-dependent epimerase/dehydratase family protein [Microbacterium sp.]